MVSAGTSGKIGDYFVYAGNQLKLVNKKISTNSSPPTSRPAPQPWKKRNHLTVISPGCRKPLTFSTIIKSRSGRNNLPGLFYLYRMRRTNCRMAFNDLPLMLRGIPLPQFHRSHCIFSCRFDRPPYLELETIRCYHLRHFHTWVSNRYILIWCRKRFPLFRDVRKRLFIQSTAMLGFTIAGDNFLHMIIVKFILPTIPWRLISRPRNSSTVPRPMCSA